MQHYSLTLIDFLNQITPSTTVLTPNRRLAASILEILSQENKETLCWKTPDILPISTWLQRLWDEYNTTSLHSSFMHYLSPFETSYVWEEIIRKSSFCDGLLRTKETADLAFNAWNTLSEWEIDAALLGQHNNHDNIAMLEWMTTFDKQCLQNNWVTQPHATSRLISALHTLVLPRKIILLGFNELSPLQTRLFTQCTALNTTVHRVSLKKSMTENDNCHSHIARFEFNNTEDELIAVARWAKYLYVNKQSRIGCVIQDLANKRDHVLNVFSDVFKDVLEESPFNLSAGKSLLHYPIIQSAFQIIRLWHLTRPIEDFRLLLFSPYIGDAEKEYIQRAKLDTYFKKNNIIEVHLKQFLYKNDSIPNYCSMLSKRIKAIYEYQATIPKKLSFVEWGKVFTQLLTLMGWPGERSLASEEYQLVEHWLQLFCSYNRLDYIKSDPVTFQRAMSSLEKLAMATIFQPKSPNARIQILGILEAASMPFDHLWVTGLNDSVWPPQPNPNPFIPKAIQREHAMPHATALRELEYCQELTNQFRNSAFDVHFSHAANDDDIEQQVSPLLRDTPLASIDTLLLAEYTSSTHVIYNTKDTEVLQDTHGPLIGLHSNTHGGASIIKQQALCPFKAFSEWRLHAFNIEELSFGLRDKDRGTLVHKALELIWKTLKDHHTLCSQSEYSLRSLINESIELALNDTDIIDHSRMQYKQLEKERTFELLYGWLQNEKLRPGFTVIQQEVKESIQINKLNLSIRIDRIDQVCDGNTLIIDYKTGKNNHINGWFGERLEEPQLPLYALCHLDNTTGITYAELIPGQYTFKGICRSELGINGIAPLDQWDTILTDWQQWIKKLSDDFCNGYAAVDPKDPPSTCTWCALKPLCRIYEKEAIAND